MSIFLWSVMGGYAVKVQLGFWLWVIVFQQMALFTFSPASETESTEADESREWVVMLWSVMSGYAVKHEIKAQLGF